MNDMLIKQAEKAYKNDPNPTNDLTLTILKSIKAYELRIQDKINRKDANDYVLKHKK